MHASGSWGGGGGEGDRGVAQRPPAGGARAQLSCACWRRGRRVQVRFEASCRHARWASHS